LKTFSMSSAVLDQKGAMDVTTVLTTLASATLGWFLNELSQDLRVRRQRHGATGRALADLLELHHYLKGMAVVFGELQKYVAVPPAELLKVMNFISEFIPLDPALPGRYENAVSDIAATDPVLAFRLRSKDQIPSVFSKLRAFQASDPTADQIMTASNDVLRSVGHLGLESSIRELALAHGIGTWLRVRRMLRAEIPRELAEFMREATTALNSPPSTN